MDGGEPAVDRVGEGPAHITHLYGKLGTHTRAEAVARARALGLLAPSSLRGQATRPD